MPKNVDAKKNSRKKKGQGAELVETVMESTERQPGDISFRLRRRMSDPMADYFSERGKQIYEESVAAINDTLDSIFKKGIQGLSGVIKKQLGELGYDESLHHFRPWLEDIVNDIGQQGMAEAISNLDGMISNLVTEYSEEGTDEPSDEDLLGIGVPDIPEEEVEEVLDFELPEAPEGEEPEKSEEEEEGAEGEPEEEAEAIGEEEEAAESAASGNKPRTFRSTKKPKTVNAKSQRRHELLAAAAKRLSVLED